MIHIAICDDETSDLKKISHFTKVYFEKHSFPVRIQEYEKTDDLRYDIQDGIYFDILLSDIQMPDMNGMELTSYIRQYLPEIKILFITTHLKYAIYSYELQIFRYIPKSELSLRLSKAYDDILDWYILQKDDFYLLETPRKTEKIPVRKIICIQKDGKYSIFVLENHSTIRIRQSLAETYASIDQEQFVYIDRGVIINLLHLTSVVSGKVTLKNGMELLISPSRLEDVKTKFLNYWGKQL